jgi:hypothetical protein
MFFCGTNSSCWVTEVSRKRSAISFLRVKIAKKVSNPEDKTTLSPRQIQERIVQRRGFWSHSWLYRTRDDRNCGPHDTEEMSTRNFSRNNWKKHTPWCVMQATVTAIPWLAQRVPGGLDSQISRQSARQGGKVFSPKRRPPLSTRKYCRYSIL